MAAAAAPGDACMICCEAYTHARKRVECAHCGAAACSSCFAQYVLTLPADPFCMNNECKRGFDRDFLAANLSKTWLLTQYKSHREQVLLEREVAMLPATQEVLQNYRYAKTARELWQVEVARKKELRRKLEESTARARTLRLELDELRASNYVRRAAAADSAPRAARRFNMQCPVEQCRGFVSTESWECGTCGTHACKTCGEAKPADGGHECDPGTAATFALVQRDTRPCPRCAVMIFKIDGCDQMFCTQCHVAYSWASGKTVSDGNIHNPHYYEYMRTQGAGAPPPRAWCDDGRTMPYLRDLERALAKVPGAADEKTAVRTIHRHILHIVSLEVPRLQRDSRVDEHSNVDLRLSYLVNDIDKDAWKAKLQQREKKRERAAAVLQVYEMFRDVARDMYRGFVDGRTKLHAFAADLLALRSYADQALCAISERFNMNVKRLRDMD